MGAIRERAAADALDSIEQKVTAIQQRDGKQVEEADRYRQARRKLHQGQEADAGHLAGHLGDADRTTQLVGGLAPDASVLHWHGEVFNLPEGAELLAWSAQTPVQAFRAGNCWGVLFHAEGDAALVEAWLAVPEMTAEAEEVLGPDAAAILRRQAAANGPDLVARSTPGFRAFARLVAGEPARG